MLSLQNKRKISAISESRQTRTAAKKAVNSSLPAMPAAEDAMEFLSELDMIRYERCSHF
jgi:hypothetical protein